MTPNPQPNKHHRRYRINCDAASNFISIFSAIIFHPEFCIRPLAASSAHYFPTSIVTSSSAATAVSSPQAGGPFSADNIDNFLRNRCGTCDPYEIPAIWSYEGTLTDPMSGKVIADVEGLELVKRLPVVKRSRLTDNNELSMLCSLHAKNLLCPQDKSTPQWDAAMTILSRRLFCYRRRSPSKTYSNSDTSPVDSLLTSLRLRPDGPVRHLSPSESMVIYDSALTYISRNEGREMVILSERGGSGDKNEDADSGNQYILGHAEIDSITKKPSSSAFEFSILAKKGKEKDGPILPPVKTSDQMRESGDTAISPPRSRFFQFGKGDGSETSVDRKYGSVRETYSYSFDNNLDTNDDSVRTSGLFARIINLVGTRQNLQEKPIKPKHRCAVLYTRYGEAPPWYSPGRSCTLELRGERINVTASTLASSPILPSLVSWAASKCNFWSGWPTTFSSHNRAANDLVRQYYQLSPESDVTLARKAVEQFCSERKLTFDRVDIDCYPIPERNRWLASTERVLAKVQSGMERLSKSLVV